MTTRQKSLALRMTVALLAAATVAFVGWEWLRLRAAREQLAALRTEWTRAQTRMSAPAATSPQAPRQTMTAAPSPSRETNVRARAPVGPENLFADRLKNDPAFQSLWLADQEAGLATRYAPLFHRLGLTPKRVAQFKAAAVRREEQRLDLRALTGEGGALSKSSPATKEFFARIEQEYTVAMRELLGDAGYGELPAFEREAPLYNTFSGIVGGATVVAREPLQPWQIERLRQAVLDASPNYRRGGGFVAAETDWSAVDAAAQAFLTPSQLAYLRTAEPPLPWGGRFQTELYAKVDAAKRRERTESEKATAGRP